MATIGLWGIYTGIRGNDGNVVCDADTGLDAKGVYFVGTDKKTGNLGSKTANITGLAATPTKIDGNNQVVDVSNPPSSPSVAWTANEINYLVKQKILGRKANGKGGFVDTDDTVECPLIIVSQSTITRKKVYFCFGRGVFNETGHNVQTNTSTAEIRSDDSLTYTALSYDKFGDKPYAVFYEDDPKFDEKAMFDMVFPGQTLITASESSVTTGEHSK